MKRLSIFLTILTFVTASCGERCEKAEGPRDSKNIPISHSDKVTLNFVADLTIKVDSNRNPTLKSIAQNQIQGLIKADNIDAELLLTLNGCIEENDPILLECELPSLKNIELNSAGKIASAALLKEDLLQFDNNGIGDIDFVVNANHIISSVKSSGDIRLSGYCQKLDFLSTSSGDLRAFDLISDTLNIHLFGSTVCDIYTNGVLNVYFYDDGIVNYRGQPSQINITGTGQVTDKNL